MNVMEDEKGNIDKAKTMAIRMNQSDQNRIEVKGKKRKNEGGCYNLLTVALAFLKSMSLVHKVKGK